MMLKKSYEHIENLVIVRDFFPEERNPEVIRSIAALLQDIDQEYYRGDMLKKIKEIPAVERANFIAQVTPLLQGIDDAYLKVDALELVIEMSAGERENFIARLTSLLQGITNEREIDEKNLQA